MATVSWYGRRLYMHSALIAAKGYTFFLYSIPPGCYLDIKPPAVRGPSGMRIYFSVYQRCACMACRGWRRPMNDQQILQELEALLEALGICVRHETLEGFPGGMCTVNGRSCMFLDVSAQPSDQARLCAAELRKRADLEALYLKPGVRRYLEETACEGVAAACMHRRKCGAGF